MFTRSSEWISNLIRYTGLNVKLYAFFIHFVIEWWFMYCMQIAQCDYEHTLVICNGYFHCSGYLVISFMWFGYMQSSCMHVAQVKLLCVLIKRCSPCKGTRFGDLCYVYELCITLHGSSDAYIRKCYA